MRRILTLALAAALVCSCFGANSGTAYAYPSNEGVYTVDYVNDTCNKYGILTQEELDELEIYTEASLDFVLKVLSRVHYFAKYPAKTIEDAPNDYIRYCINNNIFEDDLDSYNVPLTRGAFASLVINAVNNREILEINVIDDGEIPDIADDYHWKDEVYQSYKYGFFNGIDELGNFDCESTITNYQVLVVVNRILNPNLRTTVSLYSDDNVEIQCETYPMYYKNSTKGLEINITQERYYDTDCYVANIQMKNPAHIKTIYSDLDWTNTGCEISTFNKRINSILMVNGDFRNVEFGGKLGIVRNREVVNNKKFNNVLGMDLQGNLKKVYALSAQTVLDNDIRDTWTFGPWLIEYGNMKYNLNNTDRAPRTFIGQVKRTDDVLEYIIVVADGRSDTNAGLTIKQCAEILKTYNCRTGYNLDGGGSSVMMFMGQVLNDPCYGERADIDYIYIK